MSDPVDETLTHLGRHVGSATRTIAGELGRQLQRAADDRRRQEQEAARDAKHAEQQAAQEAERDKEYAERREQQNAERDAEYAERLEQQRAAREQERTDRLAARYPEVDREQDTATAALVEAGAALGVDAAHGEDPVEADAESADQPEYDLFEQEDRDIMVAAGVDPDEPGTGPSSASSALHEYRAPEISRGDDGLER